eukprot:CAMPEP_0195076554 /NCGR_PEP_ID=MMETSP0448-20130528/19179_1 /TAXON_ID=66468 /ORGANISM="Heterocapsa triquestra, Strain CCMP 448" /LENGTH=162 /DNA_ID=CAMNT_0040109095 /DNA_START=48 /DNA_END=536 /DNA_ORIENTATION=+
MASSMRTLALAALLAMSVAWKPDPCDELAPGVPCKKLYEHPHGSTFVGPCPIEEQANPDGCAAAFAGKQPEEQCPQITCPKALGKTMKLTCGGGCCPTCWAPDHVIGLDRHTAMGRSPHQVEPVAEAPTTCAGVKCFAPVCDEGYTIGFVQGSCCNKCVPGR